MILRKKTLQVSAANTRQPRFSANRSGAIMPLFAVLLPVALVFFGFAVNLAYMQLTATELKVATDAASHAGGRALSTHQSTDSAIFHAHRLLAANPVAGKVIVPGDRADGTNAVEIGFGRSVRGGQRGDGMYEYTEYSKSDVDSGNERATSVAVTARLDLPMAFNVMSISSVSPVRRSIATQVDRDIALVLDRSGSMLYYYDEDGLEDTIDLLYNTREQVPNYQYKYHYWLRERYRNSRGKWRTRWHDRGYHFPSDAHRSWRIRNSSDRIQVQDGYTLGDRLISSSERNATREFLYNRSYSDNVIYQIEKHLNPDHTLGNSFHPNEGHKLQSEMAQYAYTWGYSNQAPKYSRWYYLDLGVEAFLDVLEVTHQEEHVSLVTFASNASLEMGLQKTYNGVRNRVAQINPYGATAIGNGMLTGLPPSVSGNAARPFAAKTIVVLTDGISNSGTSPGTAVTQIIGQHEVTIHTVTLSQGADQSAMQAVANAGRGRHYHTDNGDELVEIFEEIANNLPTILTE